MLTGLLLLLSVQGPAETPALVLAQAQEAVEHDSAGRVRPRWEARLKANPRDHAALLGLAALDRLTYRYDAASAKLDLIEGSDDWALYGELERAHGALWRRPFNETALQYLAVAQAARSRNDSTLAATALGVAGFLGSRLGALGPALDTLKVAFALAPEREAALRGRILCTAGPILSFAGQPGTMDAVKKGMELTRPTGDRRAMGLCYHAVAMVAINDSDDAAIPEHYTDSALVVQRAAKDGPMLALSHYTKGYSRYSYSDFAGAKRAFADAIVTAEEYDSPFVIAWSRRILSMLYWTAGDVPASVQDFVQAESLFNMLNDGFGKSHVRNGRAFALLTRGRVAEAESTFQMQLAISERNGMAEGVFANLQSLASVRAIRGDYQGAMDQLNRAIAYGNAHGHGGWTASLDYRRGVLALRLGDLDASERYLRRYMSTASPEQFLDRYAVWTRLAEIEARRGKLSEAITMLADASAQLDSMRNALTDAQLRFLAFQTRSALDEPDLGLAATAALLVRGHREANAFIFAEARRARTLDEQVVRSALLRGDSAPERTAPLNFAAALEAPPGLAMITWLAGRGRAPSTAYVVSRDQLRAVVLPPIDSIASDIDRFVALLQQVEDATELGRRLSGAILQPAIALLPSGIDRIILVPDDRLHRLPFDALPLIDGAPLLSRYGVSRAPSVAIALRLAARPAHTGPANILALGDPRTLSLDSTMPLDPATDRYRRAFLEAGGLPALKGSRREARQVGRYSGSAEVRLGERASESFLKVYPLQRFQVIHFAGHALVDDQSESRTSLALAPGAGEDGFLGAAEISQLTLDADLVVLSACRTAAGTVVGGEGVQGLVAPLLGAGARTIVASLWPIGDRKTGALMRDFYDELADGKTAGAALRLAKLAAKDRGEPTHVWAAFTLVGDPDVRIGLRRPFPIPPLWIGLVVLLGVGLAIRRARARAA
jgi:CHAT domain-containing protein/tetratricopeptide (TPR) repeat protein